MQNFDKKHDYEISFYKHILKIETIFCQIQNFPFQKAINSVCIHPRKERLCRSQITFVNYYSVVHDLKTVIPNSTYR